jgi:tRNA pseudouridine65 synthase
MTPTAESEQNGTRSVRAPLEILHRDESIVVVNKPGGLLVHRSHESSDRVFLLQELARQLDRRVYPVHRLDRAASGAIAFALSSDSARNLQANLSAADSRKEYLALVRGSAPVAGVIERALTQHACRSEFERLAEVSRCSLLRVRISTGRRHQIRRHLAHIHHQIIGDTTYGKGKINRFFRETYGLPRLFLHAWRLELRHPETGERLRIAAPLPADLREFLSRLPDVDAALLATL